MKPTDEWGYRSVPISAPPPPCQSIGDMSCNKPSARVLLLALDVLGVLAKILLPVGYTYTHLYSHTQGTEHNGIKG